MGILRLADDFQHIDIQVFACAILERAIQPDLPFADPAAPNPMTTPPLPEQIELHRDRMWRRDEDLRVESAARAERSSKTWASQIRRPILIAQVRRCTSLYAVGGMLFAPQHSEEEAEGRRDAPRLVPQGRSHAPRSRLLRETRGGTFDVCRAALISHFAAACPLKCSGANTHCAKADLRALPTQDPESDQ